MSQAFGKLRSKWARLRRNAALDSQLAGVSLC